MNSQLSAKRHAFDAFNGARIATGCIWLAGAATNASVTLRMADPYGWLAEGSRIGVYRWFFRNIVGAHPMEWTLALIVGELTLGVLTLGRDRWAKRGLAGGAAFSAVLFSFATRYTLMMGPYALFLAWLARRGYPQSLPDLLASAVSGHEDRERTR